jgi:hypothetical protein
MLFLDAGFGEASPEAKAAINLHNFFTYTAVKIVAAQLEVPTYHLYLPLLFLFVFLLLWILIMTPKLRYSETISSPVKISQEEVRLIYPTFIFNILN